MDSTAECDRILKPPSRALRKLAIELSLFLEVIPDLSVFWVRSELATHSEALSQSQETGIALAEIEDLASLLVVVGTVLEIGIVEGFFSRPETSPELRLAQRKEIQREDGYRATHLLVEVSPVYTASLSPGRVEVRLQTTLNHTLRGLLDRWSYCRLYSESGYGEVGRLRDLFRDPENRELYEFARSDSPTGKPIPFRKMSRASFWSTFRGSEELRELKSFLVHIRDA